MRPVDKLIDWVTMDLKLRGVVANRRATFVIRVKALAMLLDNTGRPEDGKLPAELWQAKRCTERPARVWSPEQQEVIDTVRTSVAAEDANVPANERLLFVTGGPGTGKTEVVIECALQAAEDGAHVLIACPIGPLVSTYRKRIPANTSIVVETIHSAFKITRKADELHIPPGRLRHFDLIIFDEVSQKDEHVWTQVKDSLAELVPGPFVVFVGDFQQLQPISGDALLQSALDVWVHRGLLKKIVLQQHAAARCTDGRMLDFLNYIRCHQPSRALLENFFHGRKLRNDPDAAVRASMVLEASQQGRTFTFLTATNKGAAALNAARVRAEFDGIDADLQAGNGVKADIQQATELHVFREGMVVRLTRNLDKERGFVNGALGTIKRGPAQACLHHGSSRWGSTCSCTSLPMLGRSSCLPPMATP